MHFTITTTTPGAHLVRPAAGVVDVVVVVVGGAGGTRGGGRLRVAVSIASQVVHVELHHPSSATL